MIEDNNLKKKLTILICVTCLIIIGISVTIMSKSQTKNSIYKTWQRKYIVSYNDTAYVNTGTASKPIALSEAQGYGMLITVLAAKNHQANQGEFDKLLKYYQRHIISRKNHLMRWKQNEKNDSMVTSKNNKSNATDGDMDIAYALLQADELWGSAGSYNYHKISMKIINDILTYNYNNTNRLLYLGDWAKNDQRYQMLVRTSDLIPAYFGEFYKQTHDERWQILYKMSVNTLSKLSQDSPVGLLPDFFWFQNGKLVVADPNTIESKDDGHYGWNANRIPMRLAYKANDADLRDINKKMIKFFNDQSTIAAVYDLNGNKLNTYTSMAFTAPIAVAASYETKNFQKFSKRITEAVEKEPLTGNYYADTLQVLAMLMIENNKVRK